MLTNSPPFDWHLINIGNYLNIRAAEVEPVKLGDTVLAPPSQGSGGRGLPGDWTSPSRLVRAWFMQRYAKPVKDCRGRSQPGGAYPQRRGYPLGRHPAWGQYL